MWKCKNCQTISEGNFCNHCGAPRPKQSEPLVKTTKNKGLIITLVIAVVVLVTVLVGVVVTSLVVDIIDENDTSSVEPLPEEVVEEIVEEFEDFSEETPIKTPAPTATPAPQTKNDSQREAFLERARQIEYYETDANLEMLPQTDLNRETGIIFEKWDVLLNDVYQYLKKTLPSSEFATLRKAELQWIKNKEAAIESAGKEWEGGSGEPAARNTTGIRYTKARCYELIEMIR